MGFAPDELRIFFFLVIVGCAGWKDWVDAAGLHYGPCVAWLCLLELRLGHELKVSVLPPSKDRPDQYGVAKYFFAHDAHLLVIWFTLNFC